MPLPVTLQEVVEAMDAPGDGWMAYVNRRTGETVSFSEDDLGLLGAEEDDDLVADWQAEMAAKAREVEASEYFVPPPDRFEIHEYAIMERFCSTIDDGTLREDLLDAIRGSGAFRRFKSMIRRRGIEEAWRSCRAAALKEIAADFLEQEGMPFRDAWHSEDLGI